ncbi:hypothetical protein GQX73_g5994 [Xylaria multiplex]|uniref:ATP-grasp domain-containing protein n=1 Tax=Xylaria multiplex TaxID=323545 RepID=A0A7C8N672_9PEZI|nr:hypothetical protein GQX73_g5994 [Xylaria multiplex]
MGHIIENNQSLEEAFEKAIMKTPTKSQSLPLGNSLPPGDRHAVSVSLPTWDNIVSYMKGDTKIHENLQADYPRFYQHASVRKLNEAVLVRVNAAEDTRCVIFPSQDGMRRCVRFLRENTDVEATIQEVSFAMAARPPPTGEDVWARFHAVLFHERAADRAAEFWGCFGDGISSRHAEYCYERLPFIHQVPPQPSSPCTSAPSLDEVPLAPWHHSDADTKEKIKASIANYVTSEKPSQKPVSSRDVFLYAKGMCAIGTLARHLVPTSAAASEAVVFGWPYGSTPKCVKSSGYERFTFYSQGSSAELDELQTSLAAGRRIACLFCEIPSNPLCATPDLQRIRRLADQYHFVVVCDETIGTFINVDVLPYVDVVLTSLTKMFSGAANVMGGSIVINPNSAYYAELHAKFGADHEDLLFPLDAQVLLQNSLNFSARVRQANRSALSIANFLKTHELVAQVNYPTLVSSKELYEQYRRPEGGYGSLISFVLKSPESAVAFYDAVDLCKGPSFGANFTLVLPYSQLAHAHELDWAESKGLAKHIIRLSVGLEDANGLVTKIGDALRRVEGHGTMNGCSLKTVNPSTMKALQSLDRTIEWGQPGTARNDFRSDVITRPSLRMLAAIVEATLGDDVFREDRTTRDLEAHVASITGREEGMFVVTGTMANQLCLQALVTSRPCGVLVDADAHTVHYEAGGLSILSGAMVQPVKPSNGKYLRVEDLQEHAVLTDDVHRCPTGVISLENTAGGIIMPLDELRRVRDWARTHNVKIHMDGARLFEAVAAGAGSLKEFCTLVDLVSVDFSKNLGAPMGAMILGDRDMLTRMRRVRKAIGGGMRGSGALAAAAREALVENFGSGAEMESPMMARVHALARKVGEEWTRRGGKLTKDVETNIVWLDLEAAGIQTSTLISLAGKHGVSLDSRRIVCHHQIDAQAYRSLTGLFDEILGQYRGARFQYTCHHRSDTVTHTPGSTPWHSIDICFTKLSESTPFIGTGNAGVTILSTRQDEEQQYHELSPKDLECPSAHDFILSCLSKADHEKESVARFIVPVSPGYIVRSDILPLRMLDCPLVTNVVSFSTPLQFYDWKADNIDGLRRFHDVFSSSIGAILCQSAHLIRVDDLPSPPPALDLELQNRLSFSWLSTEILQRRTLGIVDGGISGPDDGGSGGCIYMAAAGLGIDMIVFDSPNHWVNGPRYSHFRKATVPLECPLDPDPGFVSRVVDAVRSYNGHLDGILTFRDHYKPFVARAAVELSMPTYSVEGYDIATDKFKTSVHEGHQAYNASGAEEASAIVHKNNLEFPLIIKPTNGFLSEGVFRIEDHTQLGLCVGNINTERHGKEFVIEKYCEGPEVDANLVLCDGEVLFFEVSDDFPKTSDVNGAGGGPVQSFIELANVFPSKLPDHELDILRSSLRDSLLRMGFRDGFFHIEARVENSSMEYRATDGIVDLVERSTPAKGPPSAWLIEVNPRPPGIQASEAVRHTYGVDYFGLALLFTLQDRTRAKQLSYPFAQGPQYHCEIVFIPVEKGGVYESGDVCADLFERRPDLAECVSGSFCFLRKGQLVTDPSKGVNSWVAYFDVFSRKSRADVLLISEAIRQNVRFSIV